MYVQSPGSNAIRQPAVAALLRNGPVATLDSAPGRKLLVPLHGSKIAAAAAIDHILALERSIPLSVVLLNVQPPIMSGDVSVLTTVEMVRKRRIAAGERALERAARMLAAAGIAYETEIAFGSPVPEIVRCATERQCDMIVMATREQGLLQTLLGRSVTQRVVKLAPMPVTVVKAIAPAQPVSPDARAAVAT
jgi:nucleotide-binding universal stress UspA family protein